MFDNLKSYLVTEYGGETLKELLFKGNLTLNEIQSYTCQILRALKYLHSYGIIHRVS